MERVDPSVRDTVRMPEAAIRAFLDHLDREEMLEARASGDVSKRTIRRHRFPSLAPVVLEVTRPGEGMVRFSVVPRNLSAGGMSIIHGVFLHPKSDCIINLSTVDGEKTAIEGILTRCRYAGARMHESGIKFKHEVDTANYLLLCEDGEDPAPPPEAKPPPAAALAEELLQLVRNRASRAMVERILDQIRETYSAA